MCVDSIIFARAYLYIYIYIKRYIVSQKANILKHKANISEYKVKCRMYFVRIELMKRVMVFITRFWTISLSQTSLVSLCGCLRNLGLSATKWSDSYTHKEYRTPENSDALFVIVCWYLRRMDHRGTKPNGWCSLWGLNSRNWRWYVNLACWSSF